MESRLPRVVRWTVVALGTATGETPPVDPLAEWLATSRPTLVSAPASSSIVAMIRARTRVLDALLGEVIAAQPAGDLTLWALGAGMDGRWWRLRSVRDRVTRYHEVDVPTVIFYKEQLLHTGPFAPDFSRVGRHALPERRWIDPVREGPERSLVLLEAAPGRLSHDLLREHLERLSLRPNGVQVVVEVPTSWSRQELAQMGWQVRAEHFSAPRTPLLAQSGLELCPAVRAFRLLWLSR